MPNPHHPNPASTSRHRRNSWFAFTSVCTALAIYAFIILVRILDINPFQSLGNSKEIRVASIAAILGMLLALRESEHPAGSKSAALLGLCLNTSALLAAWILLPFL